MPEANMTALDHLRRLASPDEMAGMGDATEPHNDSPELRARLRYARAAVDELALQQSVARGLAESARGEVHDLGSFAQYANTTSHHPRNDETTESEGNR